MKFARNVRSGVRESERETSEVGRVRPRPKWKGMHKFDGLKVIQRQSACFDKKVLTRTLIGDIGFRSPKFTFDTSGLMF